MNRRIVFAVSGIVVVAVVTVIVLYVGTLKAADPAAQMKSKETLSAADRIEQLQQRIEQLEQRIAALENSSLTISAPQCQFPEQKDLDGDGFPRARILFINDNAADGAIIVAGDNLITPSLVPAKPADPSRVHPIGPTRRVDDSKTNR